MSDRTRRLANQSNVLGQFRRGQHNNVLAQTPLPPFGVQRRGELYHGEDRYFKENPHVAGMASEDNRVILNPYSANSPDEQNAVAMNEAARVRMRQLGMTPTFQPTAQQRSVYAGTPYESNETEMRSTIVARLLSGDPSGYEATPDQKRFIQTYMDPLQWWKGGR
jgi:hypothetical protein